MKKKSSCKVCNHLRDDIKMFKHEAAEDRALLKDIESKKKAKKTSSKKKAAPRKKKVVAKRKYKPSNDKIAEVMEEYKAGKLHSGSLKGPKVKKVKQALAIAFSEARRAKKKPKKKK